MKSLATIAAALLICGATSAANAKGCIKGAVVGGVAGHYAGHHGVLGAAAGCLYGRHHAKEQQQQERQRQQQRASCKEALAAPAVRSLASRGEGWGDGPFPGAAARVTHLTSRLPRSA